MNKSSERSFFGNNNISKQFFFKRKSDRLLCGIVFREMIFSLDGDCFLYAFCCDFLR